MEESVSTVPTHLLQAMLRLLQSSWTDIEFRHEHLTESERNCITEEQFNEVLELIDAEHL